jgi:hypothetical protein
MKKALPFTAMLILALCVACTRKSETAVTTDSNSTVSSTHVESTTGIAIDTAATAEATRDAADTMREAGRDAADAARDAAHATGTALEKAGQKIQEKTATDTTGTKQ